MTKEIVEAVGVLEREKGISADRLMAALEDALLSAYKKTPGAAKYARVDMDRDSGDFRVYELILPPDLEEQLLDEVEEEAGEPTVDPETGELRRARAARDRPGAARCSTATRSTSATSRPRTSAASPRRRPSR